VQNNLNCKDLAARSSETSGNFYQITPVYISEHSSLHSHLLGTRNLANYAKNALGMQIFSRFL